MHPKLPAKTIRAQKALPQEEKKGKPPEENRGNSGQLLASRASALGLKRAGGVGAQVDRRGGAAALRGWGWWRRMNLHGGGWRREEQVPARTYGVYSRRYVRAEARGEARS